MGSLRQFHNPLKTNNLSLYLQKNNIPRPMKKLTTFFLLIAYSCTVKAQITIYNSATMNDFYGIGGYAFTQENFPNGVQSNPYVVIGPSPQNSFTYSASATGGITNVSSSISTSNSNTPITIQFKGNNVRKFGCRAFASLFGGGGTTFDVIQLTATTNLGNTGVMDGGISNLFVGFRVSNENEYITSIQATFLSATTSVIALKNIVVGDDQAQNVSLNFDGVDDYVAIPNTVGNFSTSQNFTVSCWVKPDASQPGGSLDVDILEKWDQTGSYPFVIRLLTSVPDVGKVRVARYDGSNNPAINSTVLINDGKWHHIAFVKSGSNLTLYIDGNSSGTTTDNTTGTTTNSSPLFIGQRGNGINRYKGEIDEVRIWNIAKDQATILAEMFCKNANTTNLQAAYNFNNGVPNGNNFLITQVQDAAGINHGILNNFTKTGDASNFVTGQVKYVKKNATGLNNGNSWANAFTDLQSALSANSCNDLIEIYVAADTYKPAIANINARFTIPSGMKIYGGFAGTEKNINERNMALIHTTNKTTLSGDLFSNDTPFNFATGRDDNSNTTVYINGGFVIFDGFTVRGGQSEGIYKYAFGDVTISNCRMVDNEIGLDLYLANSTVSNCTMAGNKTHGVYLETNSSNILNCLIANNGGDGIFYENASSSSSVQSNLINCTIVSNGANGIESTTSSSPFAEINNNFKNTIIKDNAVGIINNGGGTTNYVINYSLLQGGITPGTGNLAPNTNPQFVSPLANNVRSDLGDYRLKDSSPCINVGDDAGVSPLDLDRNPRPKGGKTDMGAYESNVNMNEIISIITGNWENNNTWNLARQPLNTDKVIINGHTVTVTTPNAVAKNLEYKTGAILQYLSGGLLRFGM
jgi:parallel beta-helix repeat protein